MIKNFGQKKLLGFLCILLFAMGTYGCGNEKVQYVDTDTTSNAAEQETLGEALSTEETSSQSAEPVYVYVCGAVNVPGVYAMEAGSRVCDLFDKAGGLTTDAASDYWNQARPLIDGEMIYVPTQEEADERTAEEWAMAGDISGPTESNSEKQGKININTASKEELMTLPGIGESKALAIIAYRKEHGAFSKVEELKEVEGIKDGVYTKIKDYIVIN